jgi:hypothetical protein
MLTHWITLALENLKQHPFTIEYRGSEGMIGTDQLYAEFQLITPDHME